MVRILIFLFFLFSLQQTPAQDRIKIIGNTDKVFFLSPGVYFNLVDGWWSYQGNATISFDGSDYAYNPGSGGTLVFCSQGTYSYVVRPDDVSKAIIRGTVIVASNIVTVKIEIADAHRIDIYVKDQALVALQDAAVKFDGITLFTDTTGLASFNRYPLGIYNYSVSKPGYSSLENQTLEVMAQVEKIGVTLKQSIYGIGETKVNTVKLYPNPTSGKLYITLPENNGKEFTIRITDTHGTVLFDNKFAGGSGLINMDFSGYDNGVYFFHVRGGGFENAVKLVKN